MQGKNEDVTNEQPAKTERVFMGTKKELLLLRHEREGSHKKEETVL